MRLKFFLNFIRIRHDKANDKTWINLLSKWFKFEWTQQERIKKSSIHMFVAIAFGSLNSKRHELPLPFHRWRAWHYLFSIQSSLTYLPNCIFLINNLTILFIFISGTNFFCDENHFNCWCTLMWCVLNWNYRNRLGSDSRLKSVSNLIQWVYP